MQLTYRCDQQSIQLALEKMKTDGLVSPPGSYKIIRGKFAKERAQAPLASVPPGG